MCLGIVPGESDAQAGTGPLCLSANCLGAPRAHPQGSPSRRPRRLPGGRGQEGRQLGCGPRNQSPSQSVDTSLVMVKEMAQMVTVVRYFVRTVNGSSPTETPGAISSNSLPPLRKVPVAGGETTESGCTQRFSLETAYISETEALQD